MKSRRDVRPIVLCLLGALPLAACTSKKSSGDSFDAGSAAPADECSRLGTEPYYAGIEKTSADGKLHVKIVDAIPAPPIGGDNTWTLALSDAAGKPLVGVVPRVAPTQPGRGGLGPGSQPTVTVLDANAGTVKVEHLVLPLTGPWHIDVRVGDPDGGGAPSGGGDDGGDDGGNDAAADAAGDDASTPDASGGTPDASSDVEVATFTFCVET